MSVGAMDEIKTYLYMQFAELIFKKKSTKRKKIAEMTLINQCLSSLYTDEIVVYSKLSDHIC